MLILCKTPMSSLLSFSLPCLQCLGVNVYNGVNEILILLSILCSLKAHFFQSPGEGLLPILTKPGVFMEEWLTHCK